MTFSNDYNQLMRMAIEEAVKNECNIVVADSNTKKNMQKLIEDMGFEDAGIYIFVPENNEPFFKSRPYILFCPTEILVKNNKVDIRSVYEYIP